MCTSALLLRYKTESKNNNKNIISIVVHLITAAYKYISLEMYCSEENLTNSGGALCSGLLPEAIDLFCNFVPKSGIKKQQ